MAASDTQSPALEFWFEFASTYSYLTAMRIRDMATEAGVTVIWRPFLLGPIFHVQGWDNSPFNIYPAKGVYMWRDVERIAQARGLPFKKPSIFPQNTLMAARAAIAALETDHGEEFVIELYRANFEQGADLSDVATLEASLTTAQLDASILEKAVTPDIKNSLREQTERAVALGLFGAPSFTVGNELFWGDDRLEHALDYAKARA